MKSVESEIREMNKMKENQMEKIDATNKHKIPNQALIIGLLYIISKLYIEFELLQNLKSKLIHNNSYNWSLRVLFILRKWDYEYNLGFFPFYYKLQNYESSFFYWSTKFSAMGRFVRFHFATFRCSDRADEAIFLIDYFVVFLSSSLILLTPSRCQCRVNISINHIENSKFEK